MLFKTHLATKTHYKQTTTHHFIALLRLQTAKKEGMEAGSFIAPEEVVEAVEAAPSDARKKTITTMTTTMTTCWRRPPSR